MSPVSRSIKALLALLGVACPWALFFAVAAHAAGHDHVHAGPADNRSKVVELALHGHHHDPATPAHEHSLVAAQPAPASTRMSVVRVSMSPSRFDSTLPPTVPGRSGLTAGPGESPPAPPHPPAVLRI